MKREHDSTPEDWEKDPLWDLLRQNPRVTARPNFATDVIRAARLEEPALPWWKRFRAALVVGGLSSSATAAVIALLVMNTGTTPSAPPVVAVTTEIEEPFAALNELARTEALIVAAEHPSAFSDAELVALIGF